uniref:Uncharacterized protein n=1 Tax=Arundo donax TaxID=35708 RepID=A0A0A9HFY1_ARUDO
MCDRVFGFFSGKVVISNAGCLRTFALRNSRPEVWLILTVFHFNLKDFYMTSEFLQLLQDRVQYVSYPPLPESFNTATWKRSVEDSAEDANTKKKGKQVAIEEHSKETKPLSRPSDGPKIGDLTPITHQSPTQSAPTETTPSAPARTVPSAPAGSGSQSEPTQAKACPGPKINIKKSSRYVSGFPSLLHLGLLVTFFIRSLLKKYLSIPGLAPSRLQVMSGRKSGHSRLQDFQLLRLPGAEYQLLPVRLLHSSHSLKLAPDQLKLLA